MPILPFGDSLSPVFSTYDFIMNKQRTWAGEKRLLLESDGYHTKSVEENLFLKSWSGNVNDLIKENKFKYFERNSRALHSSFVMAVNVFGYWINNNEYEKIAKALGVNYKNIEEITFEREMKKNIHDPYPSTFDVFIKYFNDIFNVAIECKYREPYFYDDDIIMDDERDWENNWLRKEREAKWGKFYSKYIQTKKYVENWRELPNLYEFVQYAYKNKCWNKEFTMLDVLQLIKHIITLDANINKEKYQLVYLYYPAMYICDSKHYGELQYFENIIKNDGIKFKNLTWNELLMNLIEIINIDDQEYINYLFTRYM